MFFDHHVNDFKPNLGMVTIASIPLTSQTDTPTCNIFNVLAFGRLNSSFNQKLSKNKVNTLQEVEQYWQQLRGTMLAPLSSDMQASDLKPFLANIFIADKFAPGLVQVGTAGAGIKNLVGDNPFWDAFKRPIFGLIPCGTRHESAARDTGYSRNYLGEFAFHSLGQTQTNGTDASVADA